MVKLQALIRPTSHCANCTDFPLIFLHAVFVPHDRKICGSACNFHAMVLQYTSWFLPRRWAAACVCESRHVPQEGSSLLKKPAKSSAARPHPSNSCGGAAPLKACFHQASAPRVRTKVTSLWSGLLQIANPVRCFIMTESVMNTTRGAKPQGSPRRSNRRGQKFGGAFYSWHAFQVWTCPVKSEWSTA